MRVISLLAGLGLLSVLIATPDAPAQGGGLRKTYRAQFIGREAPDFTLNDLEGNRVRLAEFRGRVVLLNFWYSNCLPCRKETPDLATLHRLHHEEGLVILGINLDDIIMPSSEGLELAKFLETFKVPYPILKADAGVFKAYGNIPAQPTSFLIDRQGTIVEIFWGARPGQVFDEAVRPQLRAGQAGRP
jgi:peroxiredoxin